MSTMTQTLEANFQLGRQTAEGRNSDNQVCVDSP